MTAMEPALTLEPEQRRRAMVRIILTQVFGLMGMGAFQNGVLLLYMTALGMSPVRILTYLALPNGLSMVLRLPVAYLADRFGKKRLGSVGLVLTTVGFAFFPLAGFAADLSSREWVILAGIVVLAAGKMLFAASWHALVGGVVPEEERGRFFARQRAAFQGTLLLSGAVCAWLLTRESPVSLFQIILGVLVACFFLRFLLYQGVPEVDAVRPRQAGFWVELGKILRAPGYASFCAYVFLLTLFSAGCGNLFALIEKQEMGLGEGTVVLLANIALLGGLTGFVWGGRVIDRLGTKYVFLICHFGLAGGSLGFLLRDQLPLAPTVVVGAIHFLLGSMAAASSIAISTEMLALIPPANKALSTSVCTSLVLGGGSLSGLVSAWALDLGLLSPRWYLWGAPRSAYDAVLLAYGGMMLLLVITLGLVPSVLRRAEWEPREP